MEGTDRMKSKAQLFFEGVHNQSIAVIGIGVSNTGLIQLLAAHGAHVTACDRRTRAQLGDAADLLESAGVTLKLGESYLEDLSPAILFRTPGMDYHHPVLTALRKDGAVVTSEMEVFFDLCPCSIIAVTGSDGKTTTTTLIAEMLRAQGRRVHLGGNIGRALLPTVLEIHPEDIAVVELSSFQLISMRQSPEIAVITNLSPNHLDVHKNMAEYIDAKRNLYLHQNAFSTTVLNADNETTASFAPDIRGRLRWFSLRHPVQNGAYLNEEGILCTAKNGTVTPLFSADTIRLPGIHNTANYLAAIAAVDTLVAKEHMRHVASTFGGVEHRIEFVRELDGVQWYNDSIATSPTRAIAGLEAFTQKLILLAGGYDKQIPFEPLVPYLIEKVRLLILTGATAEKIERAVRSHPSYRPGAPEICHAADLAESVSLAHKYAAPGDIVSLSPACASFDSYANFEARGKHYKDLVHQL